MMMMTMLMVVVLVLPVLFVLLLVVVVVGRHGVVSGAQSDWFSAVDLSLPVLPVHSMPMAAVAAVVAVGYMNFE